MRKIFLFLVLFSIRELTHAQKVLEPDTKMQPEWSKPYPPFRIVGNLYYVGTADLACYLITSSNGAILINTGLASSAAIIESNIQTLGFKLSDIRILLTTQAHFDHLGAMAAIKQRTGARMMVDEGDSAVVADGGLSDYNLNANACVFQPIKVDRTLHNGDNVVLGNMTLTILHHPGHTKGSCSYLFDITDKGKTYKVLIANMPTIITNKKFSDIPAYPNIARDYAYTLTAMKKMTFDLWVASHAGQFDLLEKHKPRGVYDPTVFMDKNNYYKKLNDLQKEYNAKIASE